MVTTVVKPRKSRRKNKKKSNKMSNSNIFSVARFLWTASLKNPFSISGARIPDALVAQTATMQLKERFIVNAVQDGTTGNYGAGVQFVPTLLNAWALATNYTSGAAPVLTFPAATAFTSPSQNAVATGLIGDYRVVSAGLAVFATTAMAQNQGHNICVFEPGSDRRQTPVGGAVTLNAVQQYPFMSDSPVNLQKVCSISWVPTDENNYEFHLPTCTPTGSTFANIYMPGKLAWYSTGLSASASFQVELVWNFEYHPNTAAINLVNTIPSIYDPVAMQHALNDSIVSNMFHHIPGEEIYTQVGSSTNFGLSSLLYSAMASYGNNLTPALTGAASFLGKTLAYKTMQAGSSYMNTMSGLRGYPNSLNYTPY